MLKNRALGEGKAFATHTKKKCKKCINQTQNSIRSRADQIFGARSLKRSAITLSIQTIVSVEPNHSVPCSPESGMRIDQVPPPP